MSARKGIELGLSVGNVGIWIKLAVGLTAPMLGQTVIIIAVMAMVASVCISALNG